MSEESIDLGDNPTGTPITQDQGDQILSIIGGQPLRPALTAFGVDGATPVSPTASTLRLDLLPAVGDRYVVLGSGPILSVTMPVDCKDVTLYFEDACNFGPINGWTESGDVIMISQIGEASFVTSHMRYNGTLPVSLTSLGAAAEAGRVLDDTLVSPSSTGTVAQLFSWIGGRLKEITGKGSWLTAPITTLEAIAASLAAKANLSGGNTISGTQTISGQVELTGQAASASTSAMTRALGDTRYGYSQIARKTSDTARTSTTTNADDPHLALTLEPGNYKVELYFQYYCASGTPGITSELKFSTPAFNYNYQLMRGATGAAGTTSSYPGVGGGAPTFYGLDQLNQEGWWRIVGNFDVSTTGVLSVQWAQKVSSADATTAGRGSFLEVRKIS